MTRRLRVLIVDDSADILDVYKRLINRQPDMECVDARLTTVDLEGAVARTQADVAVVDLIGPDRDSFEAISATADACPACRIIAFSGHDDPDTLEQAAAAGAWSLVSKHDHPLRLLEEIRRAMAAQ